MNKEEIEKEELKLAERFGGVQEIRGTAGNRWNDLQRELIKAVGGWLITEDYGAIKYNNRRVFNFGAVAVVPQIDEELIKKLNNVRKHVTFENLEELQNKVIALKGANLLWK